MEATDNYWMPIYNLLEGHFELIVVNAGHSRSDRRRGRHRDKSLPHRASLCLFDRRVSGPKWRTASAKAARSKGNRSLRAALVEAAHGAVRREGAFTTAPKLPAPYGPARQKEGLLAVAHSLAIAIYHLLKFKAAYHELGADFFDKLNPLKLLHPLTTRIENLGYQVQITPISPAA